MFKDDIHFFKFNWNADFYYHSEKTKKIRKDTFLYLGVVSNLNHLQVLKVGPCNSWFRLNQIIVFVDDHPPNPSVLFLGSEIL